MSIKEKLLDRGYEGVKLLSDYDNAFIGITTENRAVYDFKLMIDCLINEGGFTDINEAMEWIDYNTIRALAYMGSDAPIIVYQFGEVED